jgi:dUTP pyrophosphatase
MENINSDDISIEALKNLLTSEDNTSLFADLDISKAIEESENLIKKNVDELMNQFKTIKTEISFINNSNNPDPVYAHTGDSGFDIRANLGDTESQLILRSFERSLIPTGLHFEIPKGYDMEIKSRSGLAVKYGITVLSGTIDQNYTGEIKVLLFNSGKEDFIINHGDRIAQALIRPIITNETGVLNRVNSLIETNRKDNGFGSSGIK